MPSNKAVAIDTIPRFGKYTNWIGSPLLCNTYVAESSTVVNYEARDENHRPADRRAGGSSADHRRHKANRHTSRNAVGGPTAEVGCTSAEYECFIVERRHRADASTAPNNSGSNYATHQPDGCSDLGGVGGPPAIRLAIAKRESNSITERRVAMKPMRGSSSRVTVVAITGVAVTALATILAAFSFSNPDDKPGACESQSVDMPGRGCEKALVRLFEQGKEIFRFDTFGDEDYWGGMLQLHKAIEGAALGGVGPGVSPKTALTVAGLKVDVDDGWIS